MLKHWLFYRWTRINNSDIWVKEYDGGKLEFVYYDMSDWDSDYFSSKAQVLSWTRRLAWREKHRVI